MNGYPDETILKKIETWDGKDSSEMIAWIYEAWNHDYGSINKHWLQCKNVNQYTLITGGWSGNEDVLYSLHVNRLFDALYWQKSERGGKHVYEVKE
jgi:hypothetical protein